MKEITALGKEAGLHSFEQVSEWVEFILISDVGVCIYAGLLVCIMCACECLFVCACWCLFVCA